ncbi:hypothetical protein Adt_29868 [Abeliophyllum distichum]|uniref:Uncharacterized protein n=1 Tax=Abeliophyllum distichum TaxID=126358 RepID=A0ABD1R9M3_9LAMI
MKMILIYRVPFSCLQRVGEHLPTADVANSWRQENIYPPLTWQAPRQRSSPRQRPFCVKWFTLEKTKKTSSKKIHAAKKTSPEKTHAAGLRDHAQIIGSAQLSADPAGLGDHAQIIGSALGHVDH